MRIEVGKSTITAAGEIVKCVGRHYQHVDNGGLTMEVMSTQHADESPAGAHLNIIEGYHGYSEHHFSFSMAKADDLEAFGKMLIASARELRKQDA